jgi:hypothetical protein
MVFVFCDDSAVKLAEISAKNLGPSLIPDPTEKSAADFKFEARHLSNDTTHRMSCLTVYSSSLC